MNEQKSQWLRTQARFVRSVLVLLMGVGMSHTMVYAGSSEAEITAREELILGDSPRIAPLEPSDYPDEAVKIVADIRTAVGAPPLDEIPEYFATMARHPELMRQQIALSMTFFNGTLEVRDRQLVILRVAWLNQAPYAWSQHVDVSKREAGISAEDIERVTLGSTSPGWGARDRSILRAVEEMHEDAMISPDTWDELARIFSHQQLLELPVLVGAYQGTAYLQNSVGFRLMEGFEGLRAR